jgi:uncharacterized protein (DUF2141 family)
VNNRLRAIVLAATAALPLGGCAVNIGETAEIAGPLQQTATGSLTVRFQGIETPSGQIMLAMFDNAAAHDAGGAPVRVAAVPATSATAVLQFEGLAPGDYGIKVFHDLDGDGTIDSNPFGVPLEPFAFSNDAQAEAGPAMWAVTRFPVSAGANTITITIK